jgi:hypothetical protein
LLICCRFTPSSPSLCPPRQNNFGSIIRVTEGGKLIVVGSPNWGFDFRLRRARRAAAQINGTATATTEKREQLEHAFAEDEAAASATTFTPKRARALEPAPEGTPGGAIFVYRRHGTGRYSQRAAIRTPAPFENDMFGFSLDVSGSDSGEEAVIAAGAPLDGYVGLFKVRYSGSRRLSVRLQTWISSPDGDVNGFGAAVAIGNMGETVAIGAHATVLSLGGPIGLHVPLVSSGLPFLRPFLSFIIGQGPMAHAPPPPLPSSACPQLFVAKPVGNGNHAVVWGDDVWGWGFNALEGARSLAISNDGKTIAYGNNLGTQFPNTYSCDLDPNDYDNQNDYANAILGCLFINAELIGMVNFNAVSFLQLIE